MNSRAPSLGFVGVKIVPNNLPFLAEYSHRRAVEFQGGAGKMPNTSVR